MVIPFVDGTLDTEILNTQILLGDSSRLICINLKSLTVIFVTFFFLLHRVRKHRGPVGNIQNKVRNTEMVDEIKETYVLYTKFGDDKGEVEKLLAAGVL